MQVKVLFFGVLVEVTGSNIKFYSDAKTMGALKFMIQDDFPEIVHYSYCISLNNEIVSNDRILKDGDEIALLPPFAGG
ncbi:MAG TPA: MoaD/ThiS family protein [Bacteroidales bacterium]